MAEIKKKTQFIGVLMLFLTAFIWGTAFVAQSVGMKSVEAFTFNGLRMLMGAAVLVPIIVVREIMGRKKMSREELIEHKKTDKKTVVRGLILGCALCLASNLQQFAFNYTTAGKVAFVSAFYMLFVPVFGLIFGKKVPWMNWVCVGIGVVGLYFLCINPSEHGAIGKGEIFSFSCAVAYSIQILMVEKFVQGVDGIKLSCIQFSTCGVISIILMAIFEHPTGEALKTALIPLLYSGILSCGVAFTFQVLGQKYTESTVASLLMCMESVFGVLAGAIILHETLSGREIAGCVIMFVAIILAQVSPIIVNKIKEARKNKKKGAQTDV